MGIATRKMRSIDRTLIASVTWILSPIFSETCFPSREKLCPKSRGAIRPSHRTYCTWIGWARPQYSPNPSPPSAVTLGFRSVAISTGPPGAAWMTRKEMRLIPIRSGTVSSTRWAIYRSIRPLLLEGGVPLLGLGNVPLDEVVGDPRRRRLDPADPMVHDRKRVRVIEEDVGLILRQDLLDAEIGLLPPLGVEGAPPLLEEPVHIRVLEPHEIELLGAGLLRAPDVVLVGVLGDAPAEDHRIELPLVDELVDEGGPLQRPDLHLDPDGGQVLLDDRGRLRPALVPRIGEDREGKRHPSFLKDAVPRLPPRFGQERLRLFRVVRVPLHVGVVHPRPRLLRPGGLP